MLSNAVAQTFMLRPGQVSAIIIMRRTGPTGPRRCRSSFTKRLKTMTDLKLVDHYSFRARLQPALLALLPLAFALIAWTEPGARWLSVLWTIFGTAGGTFFLATFARNRGRSLEAKLWDS